MSIAVVIELDEKTGALKVSGPSDKLHMLGLLELAKHFTLSQTQAKPAPLITPVAVIPDLGAARKAG